MIALLLALALALSGCGGGGSGESGSADAPRTSQTVGETTSGGSGETVMEETTAGGGSTESISTESTSTESASTQGATGGATALSGVEAARREAKSWSEDSKLYAIAAVSPERSAPPDVNAEGESEGWMYSFVSESKGSVLLLPYVDGELQDRLEQNSPPEQVELISSDTLPVDKLVDSSEAIQRAGEVQSYLEKHPDAGASAGIDSASSEEPQWTFSVPGAPEMTQEQVPAVE